MFVLADVRLAREALASALSGDGVAVVGSGCPSGEIVQLVRDANPSIILAYAPSLAGYAAIHALVAGVPSTTVVALGADVSEADVIRCLEAGVTGFIRADATREELVDGLRKAAAGEMMSPSNVVEIVFRHVARRPTPAPQRTRLSLREVEIADLVVDGRSNKEIAASLFIEVATVKNHVHSILEKLGIGRRAEIESHLAVRSERSTPAAEDWQRAS